MNRPDLIQIERGHKPLKDKKIRLVKMTISTLILVYVVLNIIIQKGV